MIKTTQGPAERKTNKTEKPKYRKKTEQKAVSKAEQGNLQPGEAVGRAVGGLREVRTGARVVVACVGGGRGGLVPAEKIRNKSSITSSLFPSKALHVTYRVCCSVDLSRQTSISFFFSSHTAFAVICIAYLASLIRSDQEISFINATFGIL